MLGIISHMDMPGFGTIMPSDGAQSVDFRSPNKALEKGMPVAFIMQGETRALEVKTVVPEQPCPCGTGRRFEQCHGRTDPQTGKWIALPNIREY